MEGSGNTEVAVLLATYNGAKFIEAQLQSLTDNVTAFTLHWIDDHSTDNSGEIVRSVTARLGIPLCEWHESERLGVPGVFFHLLECAEADIYLFCDQDDIWQPGKIDVTVGNLLPDLASPALCYTDPLLFTEGEPEVLRHLTSVLGISPGVAAEESRLFMHDPAMGHTIGFTCALRAVYMNHKEIARTHAIMHDCWMYMIAHAAGTVRMLLNSPTTLFRRHRNNSWEGGYSAITAKDQRLARLWRLQSMLRPKIAKQSQGFIRAAPTLPPGPKLERLLALARLVANMERRQSPLTLLRLAAKRAMPPVRDFAWTFALACLCSHAKAGDAAV